MSATAPRCTGPSRPAHGWILHLYPHPRELCHWPPRLPLLGASASDEHKQKQRQWGSWGERRRRGARPRMPRAYNILITKYPHRSRRNEAAAGRGLPHTRGARANRNIGGAHLAQGHERGDGGAVRAGHEEGLHTRPQRGGHGEGGARGETRTIVGFPEKKTKGEAIKTEKRASTPDCCAMLLVS